MCDSCTTHVKKGPKRDFHQVPVGRRVRIFFGKEPSKALFAKTAPCELRPVGSAARLWGKYPILVVGPLDVLLAA